MTTPVIVRDRRPHSAVLAGIARAVLEDVWFAVYREDHGAFIRMRLVE